MLDDSVKEFEVRVSDGCMLRGLRYSCEDFDESSPTALCLHGFGSSANSMHWIASALSRAGINVVAPDMRGHGLSGSARGKRLTPNQQAKDMTDVCKELALGKVFVVTQSFGGWVGLHLLRQNTPGLRIERLYAFAPNWFLEPRKISEMKDWIPRTAKLLWRVGRLNGFLRKRILVRIDYTHYAGRRDFYIPRIHEEVASMSWPTFAARFVALQTIRHRRGLGWESLSSLPVSIFAAREDRMVENAELEKIAERTGWSLDWIDCGHLGVSTEKKHADAFVRRLLASL